MSNTSCRKAKEWLINHNLEFKEINWQTTGMSRREFNKILSLTETGIQEIISKRSLAYPYFAKEMDRLSLKDVFVLIHCERSLLRLPLIVDEERLQVGYNFDDIRQFIPREKREMKRSL